ncbi:Zinc finger, PMZ-type [Corchorus olitorius]|uniref:Protein FAR1-RELATED SEQUENCE n=1 Tax=Corchorus olitorius TaxID=93759 RepID=A0A1R3KF86_9ROSI|nr:Zinc finger, PMZ-type [Corchorus olitorius]
MDAEVVQFDIGLGGGGSSGRDGDDDANIGFDMDEDMADSPAPSSIFGSNSNGGGFGRAGSEVYLPEGDLLDLEPYEGMEFESEEAAKAFYNSYARRVGFSTRDSGKWVVSGFVREHNHELVPPDQVHCLRSHRQISGPAKTLIDTLQAAGMGPRRIMSALIKEYGGISKTWLTAMSGRPPVSITTDHDAIIRSAIMQVFPETRHRFCKWHIFKKCQEKLSHVFLKHPAFEADFHKCVNLPESTEEFESCWLSLVDRYELRDHEWLQMIYEDRRQWVPVYLRDTFFAEMSITQRSDSMNSYFDGFVNASTNLNQFFKLYEKALESRNEKEVKADYDTMNTSPVLKTPSPMEKQASELYTRKLFTRFQEELVGTLTFMASKSDDDGDIITYQVAKFGEDHRAYYVKFNVLEMKASCSCQMFEFSGLLCRHVLAVFRVTNVLTLPSHYILKRWTRNAKSSVILEERASDVYTSYLESHTVRYNTLRHEAFKFVDEGSKSLETYDVAIGALKEAAKRVARATKNEGRPTMINGRRGDTARDASRANITNHKMPSQPLSEDDMDKKIRELTSELEYASRKCDVYRANLLSVLKDIEDHKLQLSIKVQNIKISIKDGI